MSENMSKKFLQSEFSKKTGLEITATTKLDKKTQAPMCGQVTIRFFPLTSGKDGQIRYMMEPGEAMDIAYKIRKILAATTTLVKDKIKEKMPPHKFTKDNVDILTTLAIECYANGGKNNYAVSVSRGKDLSINVPIMESRLYRMALFLERLSLDQSWEASEYAGSSNSTHHDPEDSESGAASEQSQHQPAPEKTKLEILSEKVKKHGVDMAVFLKYFSAKSMDSFPDNRLDEALNMITQKYEKAAA